MAIILISICPKLTLNQDKYLSQYLEALEELGHTVFLLSKNLQYHCKKWSIPYQTQKICPKYNDRKINEKYFRWVSKIESWDPERFGETSGVRFVDKSLKAAYELYDAVKPDLFIVWNKYDPTYGIIHDYFKDIGIPIMFMEWGLLKNSFILDAADEFFDGKHMDVTYQDLWDMDESKNLRSKGESIIEKLRLQKDNVLYSKKIENTELVQFIDKYKKATKILCFASGNYVGDKLFNGQIFCEKNRKIAERYKSGWDVAAELLKDPDVVVIYKPHPNSFFPKPKTLQSERLFVSSNNVIDLLDVSDCVVAWGTKLELLAILHGKPLVLPFLGFLYGKGCAYEVAHGESVKSVVDAAVQEGVTEQHIRNLCLYIGWLATDHLHLLKEGVSGIEMFSYKISRALADSKCNGEKDEQKLSEYFLRYSDVVNRILSEKHGLKYEIHQQFKRKLLYFSRFRTFKKWS
jgi:hypothetical protein